MLFSMLGAGLLTAAVAAMPIDWPRGALWQVVRFCGFAERVFDRPFPCVAVRLGPEGFAILHASNRSSHFIVTPTHRLSGLESGAEGAVEAQGAWHAALALRSSVAATTGTTLEDVALSVNPRRSRSQDQFHIHVGCGDPTLLAAIRREDVLIGSAWARLDRPVDGTVFWARRVLRSSVGDENPLASLAPLAKSRVDPANVVFVAFGLTRTNGSDLVQLVTQTAGSSAEDALDPDCHGSPVHGRSP